MAKIEVCTAVLQWAVERAPDPDTLHLKFPKLGAWLRGEDRPTVRQLEALARVTATPFGYLFLQSPPDEQLPIPHFRTVRDQQRSRPSANLLETVRIMQRRQAWMREYLIEEGNDPLPFVGSASLADDPSEVADKMRAALGLENGWAANERTWTDALRSLRHRMESVGILVVVNGLVGNNTSRKLDVREFRGFVLVDEYAPLVFVNGADGKAAQMFTLAHELAHIWFGRSAVFDLYELHPAAQQTELACNRVAAEFLVPSSEFAAVWQRVQREPDRFQQVARRFKVSELVAARRALDLRMITRSEFRQFYNAYIEAERRRNEEVEQEGGNFFANQQLRIGRRLSEAIVRAAKEGRLLYREAYQLSGLYGKTFDRYAQTLERGGLA